MRTVLLGDTGIETTILGFGCAELFRQSRAGRQRMLAAAYDAGIRHFDVAPMYGLGSAEREVGRFARGRRDELVLATKFGITPTTSARLLAPVQRALARVVGRGRGQPGADPRGGAAGRALYRSGAYDGAAAKASLERSLRALGSDYVDVLFLHDPRPGDVRSDDVRSYLEAALTAGTIRSWGVAGDPDAVDAAGGAVPILQVRADIFDRSLRELEPGRAAATVLFGAIGRALPRLAARLHSDQPMRRRWSDAVGADCGREDVLARLLLRDALRENDGGPVLFSTTRASRVSCAADAVDADVAGDEALQAFRALVAGELSEEGAA